jgi:hypothetical protein
LGCLPICLARTVKSLGRYRHSQYLFLLGAQDALNLLEMIEVVSCEHADDRFDGFRTSLIVYAVVLPLLRREGLKQRKIGLA